MTLLLDDRRLAMLEQFGIRLPADARAAEPEAAPSPMETVQAGARVEPIAAQAPGIELAPRASGIELMEWDELGDAVASCRACKLCATRRNTVFGVGDLQADWLVVGEAPGENEDLQGEPFVGQAGKLLDNMLKALGLSRHEKVYIANVLKCRPPGNRNPEPEEVSQCEPFLRRQVQLLQPKIIVAMGRFAVQSLLGTTEAIGKLRGQRHTYAGVPVIVTYHPAYLLRSLPDKAKAWADLCLAREIANTQG
ncbi:MAG TPA: uracil-DNA glycosylase [Ramlibacter sp.]|jgi:DNA polymerase|nr:uracil-DNA glycosylase [Ramlibacter sp.]